MRRRARIALTGALVAAALVVLPARTEAVTVGFDCITANSGACDIFESAYTVDVELFGTDIGFTFHNQGYSQYDTGVITQIYFDDDNGYLDTMQIFDSAGVDFEEGGSPSNLPAGIDASFMATQRATADNPAPTWGISEGEQLRIEFSLLNNFTLQNILTALQDGSLRIGLHVQSININNGDYSESFVNDPFNPPTNPTPVPEPASLILFGSGLAGLAGVARKLRAERTARQR